MHPFASLLQLFDTQKVYRSDLLRDLDDVDRGARRGDAKRIESDCRSGSFGLGFRNAPSILYLSKSTLPSQQANSVHVMKMAQALSELGCEVTLVARDGGGDPFSYYGVSRKFRILKFPHAWRRRTRKVALRILVKKLPRIDLFYGRDAKALLECANYGAPLVFEAHLPPADEGEYRIQQQLFASSRSARLVVITEALKKEYIRLFPGLDRGRILVAPDGADPFPDGIEPKRLPGARIGHLQVGYSGHLYRGKGMEVIARLAPLAPWADFHVIGGTDEDLAVWRDRVAGIDNLHFHGFVPHGEISACLAAFDVALAPLQKRVMLKDDQVDIGRWTSPLKIFEYMAAGCAIVCSDLPVLREVIVDGETALLCPPDEPEAWAEALAQLRDDPDFRERLGNHARSEFAERFTWQSRARYMLGGFMWQYYADY